LAADKCAGPIGGYFELEIPSKKGGIYQGAHKYQSARAAFASLLEAGRPKKIWLPKYTCDAMLAPAAAARIDIGFYDIDSNFRIEEGLTLEDGDWLLYVNYFGVCSFREEELLQRFQSSRLIFDHSQAFFTPERDCLATIYSLRKFFGVPDGGLLISDLEVTEPSEVDSHSVDRSVHLLKRLDGEPEQGYQDYKKAEETLCDLRPRRMSRLTEKILAGVDFERCRHRRADNFRFLHQHLGDLNGLSLDVASEDSPLCYPLLIDNSAIRSLLLANRIFVPTYWPEVTGRVAKGSFESDLVNYCLPLPCDHRYDLADMARVVDVVKGAIA
jgi:hypothetical protein